MTYYTNEELNYILDDEGFRGDIVSNEDYIYITEIDENWELEGVYYEL